jgi:hypothetical protein
MYGMTGIEDFQSIPPLNASFSSCYKSNSNTDTQLYSNMVNCLLGPEHLCVFSQTQVCLLQDVMTDGGFETGAFSPAFWNMPSWNNIPMSFDNTVARTGTYSLRTSILNIGGGQGTVDIAFPVQPGASYRVSYWYYQSNNKPPCFVISQLWPCDNYSIRQHVSQIQNTPQGQWVKVTTPNPIVAYTSIMNLRFLPGCSGSLPDDPNAFNKIWLDDVSVNLVSV